MDALKILGSLISSGALSKGSGGDVLGNLLGAALGGSKNQQTQGGGALGDILGSLIGGGQSSGSAGGLGDLLGSVLGGAKSSGSAGGLGDLLGSVLGGGKSSGSAGGLGDLLGSVLGGEKSAQSPAKSASDLEDLLGIGKKKSSESLGGAGGLGGLLGGALAKYAQQTNPNVANPSPDKCDYLPVETDQKEAVDHATLIIRAMINAAKSDGSIDNKEQDKIIAKLGDITQEEANFVRSEFAAPLDVKSFINSVPRGMEQQIYAISLMAIDLDKNSEAQYLAELAKGLNIQPEMANNLHTKLGAPKIFA